ncbi:hypothetical protein ThimaDRAFT_1602 [Thiocapsa marina 5811]|uniref:Pvc16 N-terminal domain-containing protein n=1 Tax=Thiocapsa marina 5811 TaxID=768671 RepID=F9U9K0_9GAMM|nr:hypothetical protein ThimaDRAFT_1602 [Thiocapsa marina 5811]
MIFKVLEFLRSEIDEHLMSRFEVSESIAVLSNLVDRDGTPAANIDDKIVLTLAKVERVAAVAPPLASYRPDGNQSMLTEKTLPLNLSLLISATSKHYPEALKHLSETLTFLQACSFFTSENASKLPDEVQRIAVDLVDLDFQQLNNLWGIFGNRYIPSVLFNLRLVLLTRRDSADSVSPIRGIDTQL